ncbi:hypothetical protein OM076_08160 [Solirubrobacter ginsenosidimutans]|uniref:Uncharacterized protein n=1 Tax=Solirubrobacter ginsenosidimutans TaxID=490573 RepID=A0A9X3MS62_9ACTN|nr:hypothetical protein [Solirubrobacter ginsenosidimutans]MDA0160233.1 hypothetical protein [Solirubrobacter ginsenosidimutans]
MRLSLPSLAAAVGSTAAALAAATPAQGADAVFGGTATGGAPIVIRTDAKTQVLKSIAISWDASCANGRYFGAGDELTPVEPVDGFSPGPAELLASRNAKGHFAGSQLAARDLGDAVAAIAVQLSGKFNAKRSTGTLSATVKIMDKATSTEITSCDSRKLSWVAARAPGTVYGGVTSQGEPMVLRLDSARRSVSDVITTWDASCGDAGFLRSPDHFVRFPIKSTGRFGNAFTADDAMDAGAKRHVDYDIKGRVSTTAAKGTLQVKVTDTDATGVATTCDSAGVTWKAATG